MSKALTITFLLLTLLLAPPISIRSSVAVGARLGGRTEVKDVESNGEIQDLGKFCVQQYNLKLQKRGSKPLEFSKVVEAQTQVVSGIKYYLKISASGEIYDAEVVIRPWVRAKEMLTFAPSPHSSGN
ncbi:cysteine proteinase inhibitor B-like [Henckelia pumila]|uniref:cysteine proteinase inhibitor B-like n=1 Tax=Henckelia pumila TaxID=405737 RepID=UPI003C6E36E0